LGRVGGMDKKTSVNLWYFLIAMAVLLAFQGWWTDRHSVAHIPYSQFEQYLREGKIEAIAIRENTIEGTLRSPRADGGTAFRTVRVEPALAESLLKYNVRFQGLIESRWFGNLLSWLLPLVVFFVVWIFFIRQIAERQGAGGLMTLGKSKAKVYVETDTKVTFDDVAGVDEAKEELKEIVSFLRNPQEYGRLGARIPKGILLVGPPGTGKTLLARAVAGEAGVPFFSISGSEFVEMFVGLGAARVRDLFEQARKAAPCIIFADELDALGRARGIGPLGGGHDEKEQTLNQLLAELDGFDPSEGIVLLAATNRPEILDPALLRAGRFDRQVLVDRPDRIGRVAILNVHLKKVQCAEDVDPEQIAGLTPGFTGADLANLVNEAALLATRRRGERVTMADFTAAVERIVAGLEKKSRILNEDERRTVAYHEMGHALVATALPKMDPVHKISIIPRGISALGYTIQRPTEDRFLMSKSELENKMAVLLAGRAAEKLVFDEVSTGAADDLDKATEIARGMVTRYGMSEKLGEATYERNRPSFLEQGGYHLPQEREFSEETAREIDCAVRELIDNAGAVAHDILAANRRQLEEGAQLLLEKETLTSDEIPKIGEVPKPASAAG
jgi:cell division protease FtsH